MGGTKDTIREQNFCKGVWERQDGLERRMLPHGWCLWICTGVSLGDKFSAFRNCNAELEGVCVCSEWPGMDSHAGPMRSRHVLWLALHQLPKLPHSIIVPVRLVCSWSDNSTEAATGHSPAFNTSGQDSGWICSRIISPHL